MWLIQEDFTAPLSNQIQKEYNKLISLIALVPAQSRTKKIIEGTGGLISITDVIAYQIGWGNLLINCRTHAK